MSEPPRPSRVRAADSSGFTNPILSIEELRRFPPPRSRAPAPGTTLVFRARSGRLHAPKGGYTAGELFFLGPRTGYQIDTAPHGFAAAFELGRVADGPVLVAEVAGTWRVADPVAVVAHRVSDLEYACTTELVRRIEAAAPGDLRSPDGVRDALRAAWPAQIEVAGGVRLEDLHVDVRRDDVLTGEKMIQLLVADEDDGDPADPASAGPGQLVHEIQSLAAEGLAELGDADRDSAVGRALMRLNELAGRMAGVLPPDGDRPGDDPAR